MVFLFHCFLFYFTESISKLLFLLFLLFFLLFQPFFALFSFFWSLVAISSFRNYLYLCNIGLIFIFLLFLLLFLFFCRLLNNRQISGDYWSFLVERNNIIFFTERLVIFFLFFLIFFQSLFQSAYHCVVFFKRDMFNHLFEVKLFGSNVRFSFHFLFDFSFSELIKALTNDFCTHVLFFLFFAETSPIQLSIFSKILFTSFKINLVDGSWRVIQRLLLLFIRLFFH